jgi:ABC-2 type transport system permease protein
MSPRLGHLIRKELLQLRRDRRMLFALIFAPIFQLFIFGYAVTLDIKHIRMVVCDLARTADSRELVNSFARSGYFDLAAWVDSPSQMGRPIESGRALIGLYVPHDFSKRLARDETAQIQVILDGTDMNSAGVAGGYTAALIAQYSGRRQSASPTGGGPAAAGMGMPVLQGIENRPRILYNPELRSVNYMVPGVICMILGTVMTAMTAMAIVREREAGTLEQLIVTPIRPWELMLGKTLPFAAIGLLDVVVIIIVARAWFQVPMAGSGPLLLVLAIAFLLTTLGLGLFISTVSRTQQQAMLTAFFVLMPSVILSGFMFPIENMPRAVQWITYAIPLRYFVEIVRGIFLRGAGISVLWPQAAALVGLGGTIFALSALRFQKRLG